MKTIIHGQLVGMKKLNSSAMGNPQYMFTIYTPAETFEIRTGANYGWVYQLSESYLNKWYDFQVSGIQRRAIIDMKETK